MPFLGVRRFAAAAVRAEIKKLLEYGTAPFSRLQQQDGEGNFQNLDGFGGRGLKCRLG